MIGGVGGASALPRADATVKAVPGTQWSPKDVTVSTGETVTWDFNSGDNQAHNVKGETGPAEDANWPKFNSVPSTTGSAEFTFTQPGTYTFICLVHPAVMKGTVTVTGSAVTPTPTPPPGEDPPPTDPPPTQPPGGGGATPLPTAGPTAAPPSASGPVTPAPFGSSRADVTAPVVSKLKLKAVKHGARVRFSLSEASTVTIRFKRGSRAVRTARLSARAGKRSVTVRSSRLTRGRYTVQVEARDARGNRAARSAKVRVKR
jgi:plastocyanin